MIEQQLRKSLQEIYHALHLPLLKFMLSPYLSLPQLRFKYQTIIRTPTYFVDLILINLEIIAFSGSAYRSPSLLTSVCIRFRSQTIVVSTHSCNRRISFSIAFVTNVKSWTLISKNWTALKPTIYQSCIKLRNQLYSIIQLKDKSFSLWIFDPSSFCFFLIWAPHVMRVSG